MLSFYNDFTLNFNLDKLFFFLNINEYYNYVQGSNNNSGMYYTYLINKMIHNFYSFYFSFNEYLYHIIIYSFNLPLFFYFGLLFIFTTVASLLLLSYLGLYGVFLLNMISIFLF